MGHQEKASAGPNFSVNLCGVFMLFCFFIATNSESCCPWDPNNHNKADDKKCGCSCKLNEWTLQCNVERTICYDALTAPNNENLFKPTRRFNAGADNNDVDGEGEKNITFNNIMKLKGNMSEFDNEIGEFGKQIGDGLFIKDFMLKNLIENNKNIPTNVKIHAGKIASFPAAGGTTMVDEKTTSTTSPPPPMNCDFSDWENAKFVDVCDSDIYCRGRIIQAMNYHLFYDFFKKDSKHFVDSPLKEDASKVLAEFERQFPNNITIKEMDPDKLKEFYNDYFKSPDDTSVALLKCNSEYFDKKPKKLKAIKDPVMRKFALELHDRWSGLCRQINHTAADSSARHSLIYVKNRFIVPGGRFREYYYWDSLWTILGLMESGYKELAQEMIENFIALIKELKFVPNGGRIYYKMRSQPPLLAEMVSNYIGMLREDEDEDNKIKFLKDNVGFLVEELNFWEENRKVEVSKNGKTYQMYQYRTESRVPRPESYCVDVLTAMALKKTNNGTLTQERAGQLFQDLASAAESGWDFSSRWMADPDEPKLSEIITTQIVPVDLNAYICGIYKRLMDINHYIGDDAQKELYRDKFEQFRQNFTDVFYLQIPNASGWYDYNLKTGKYNIRFYGSMVVPLFMRCYDDNKPDAMLEALYNSFKAYGVFDIGKGNGMPTSKKDSGQQWDLPNIWPPLVHMMIVGFQSSGNQKMKDEAAKMAKEWIFANYAAYKKYCGHQNMWEKLTVDGEPGGGGEYEVQPGFGWTNGAILNLLVSFYSDIKWDKELPACIPVNNATESMRKSWSFHKHLKTLG